MLLPKLAGAIFILYFKNLCYNKLKGGVCLNKYVSIFLSIVVVFVAVFSIGKLAKSYKEDEAYQKTEEKVDAKNEKDNQKEDNQKENKKNNPQQEKNNKELQNNDSYIIKEPQNPPQNEEEDKQNYFDEGFDSVGNGDGDSYKITTTKGQVKPQEKVENNFPKKEKEEKTPQKNNTKNKKDTNSPIDFDDMSEEDFLSGLDPMEEEEFFDFEFGGFD